MSTFSYCAYIFPVVIIIEYSKQITVLCIYIYIYIYIYILRTYIFSTLSFACFLHDLQVNTDVTQISTDDALTITTVIDQ